jgi:hypothetical protein
MTFVTYEDRPSEFPGIRVLLRSLARYQPDWSGIIFLPGAPQELCDWCAAQKLRSVRIVTDVAKRGWNSKPFCILAAMSEGHDEVLWLDSDLALAAPLEPILKRIPRGTVVATEEAPWFNEQGTRLRTEGWGFEVGRTLPISINSCAMRFDTSHRELLETWNEMLQSDAYIAGQRMNWRERPVHMKSDQDILNALLGSKRFAATPLVLLKNGLEIAQCFEEDGYRVGARLAHAFRGLPPIVHTQGSKPWRDYGKRLKRVWVQLSPYPWLAENLCGDIPEIAAWARVRMPLARVLNAMALGDPSLRGMIPAMLRTSVRIVGRPLRRLFRKSQTGLLPKSPAAELRTSP